MIITNLIGGLGNQMFQYAAGRALSLSKSVEIRLRLRDFTGYKVHNGFELDRVFGISAQAATDADLWQVLGWRALPIVLRAMRRQRFSWLRGSKFVVEPRFTCWQAMTTVPDDCYLQGYWQSEKYFLRIAPTIRADFSFKQPLEARNLDLAEQIDHCNAISLHVRRGDFAVNPATLATHGLCSPDYYYQAIRYIAERVVKPMFFVFSDDIPWAKRIWQSNSTATMSNIIAGAKATTTCG